MKNYAIVLMTAILLGSCHKNEKAQPSQETEEFTILSRDIKPLTVRGNVSDPSSKLVRGTDTIPSIFYKVTENSLVTFTNNIKASLSGDARSINTTAVKDMMLFSTSPQQLNNIDYTSLIAIMTVYTVDGEDWFDYYTVSNGVAVKSAKLTSRFSYFTLADLSLLAGLTAENNTRLSLDAVYTNKPYVGDPYKEQSDKLYFEQNELAVNLISKTNRLPDYDFRAPVADDFGDFATDCDGRRCSPVSSNICKKYTTTGEFTCNKDGICPYRVSMNFASAVDSNFISSRPIYEFRNRFMRGKAFGEKYITYYYKLGYVIGNQKTINFSNFGKHYRLLKQLTEKMNIYSGSGNSNAVLVDNNFYQAALDVLNIYKPTAKNTELLTILTDIERDLNTLRNLTKSQVSAIVNR